MMVVRRETSSLMQPLMLSSVGSLALQTYDEDSDLSDSVCTITLSCSFLSVLMAI